MSRGTVGVVGLGLMGGSLARDLSAAGWRVQGDDRDPGTVRAAVDSGVVAGAIDPAAVDGVVLAVPGRAIPGRLRRLAAELPERAVVTDVGSTKRSVVDTAVAAGLGPRFVGGHPMAGDHRNGWEASRTGLFEGATVWCCDTPETTAGTRSRVEALWRSVGGLPRSIDPVAHDRLMARVSHGPQVVASALAGALAEAGVSPEALGPGGRDMTRLAGSDPAVWTDILSDNRDQAEAALEAVMGALTRFRRALRTGDDAALASLLAAARTWRRQDPGPEPGAGRRF